MPIVRTSSKRSQCRASACEGESTSRLRVRLCPARTAPPIDLANRDYPELARSIEMAAGLAFRRRKGVGMSHFWSLPRAYP